MSTRYRLLQIWLHNLNIGVRRKAHQYRYHLIT